MSSMLNSSQPQHSMVPPGKETLDFLYDDFNRSHGKTLLEEEVKSLVKREEFDTIERILLRVQDEFLFPAKSGEDGEGQIQKASVGLTILSTTAKEVGNNITRFLNMSMSTIIKFMKSAPKELRDEGLLCMFELALVCVFNPNLLVSRGGIYIADISKVFGNMLREERMEIFSQIPCLYREMVLGCLDKRVDENVETRTAALQLLAQLIEESCLEEEVGLIPIYQRYPSMLKYAFEALSSDDGVLIEAGKAMDLVLRESVKSKPAQVPLLKLDTMTKNHLRNRSRNVRLSCTAWQAMLDDKNSTPE